MIQLSSPTTRLAQRTGRADVEGAELADGVAVADDQFGGFARVLLVLRDRPSELNWKMRLSRPMVV
jgi:hypothetical protein